ncbi:MAG TPA: GntR family transcriptional regulator [Alphaproteobacteria bacterium]|nr:GntR family transcriptional regulator [Alphaproteobacteria bacterium]
MASRPGPAFDKHFVRSAAPSTATDVFQHLREKIVRGEWVPGQRLSENEVARSLGVSRTPVREAFIRLRQEALIRVYPQSGTVVSPIDLAEVEDSQFLRETLECRTVALAAESCTAEQAEALCDLIERQRRCCVAGREADFVAFDDEMHHLLVTISGRKAVWRVVRDAKGQLDRVRHLSLQNVPWIERNVREHEAIIDCVARRDPKGAEAAMRHHLRNVFQSIERIAQEHADFFESAGGRTETA